MNKFVEYFDSHYYPLLSHFDCRGLVSHQTIYYSVAQYLLSTILLVGTSDVLVFTRVNNFALGNTFVAFVLGLVHHSRPRMLTCVWLRTLFKDLIRSMLHMWLYALWRSLFFIWKRDSLMLPYKDYHNTGSSFGCWKPTGTGLCTSQNYSSLSKW